MKKEIKETVKKIRKIKKERIEKFYAIISKSKHLTSLYYLISPRGFQNEQYAVMNGLSKNVNNMTNVGNFRRSIHRIEKGLITQPAKPVFAESYILETVLIYKELRENNCENKTLLWAEGILSQYFETVEKTKIILRAFDEFDKISKNEGSALPRTYFAEQRLTTSININDFYELNKQRRSIRYFQNKEVSRDKMEKAVRVALQSPSACNRQPFKFRIIDDPVLVKEAAKIPMGATTFSKNIPVMIFVIGDLSNYFDERDKHLIYIDGSLATMNFILSLEVQGLSSCIINWSDIPRRNKNLKNFLNLEKYEQCVMCIAVGYALPKCGIATSIKKDVRTTIKYN